MNNNIQTLQEKQFGGLHNFLSDLSLEMLQAVYSKYGEEVLDIVEKVDMDLFGLYRWHLQRILAIIGILKSKYGAEVVDVVSGKMASNRYNEGVKLAQDLDKNSLDDLLPSFTFGNSDNIIEIKENEAKVKWEGCLAGKIAQSLERSDILFNLYCKSDHAFVSGFNPKLGCEHIKTVMNGDDCCIHRLYVKDK